MPDCVRDVDAADLGGLCHHLDRGRPSISALMQQPIALHDPSRMWRSSSVRPAAADAISCHRANDSTGTSSAFVRLSFIGRGGLGVVAMAVLMWQAAIY